MVASARKKSAGSRCPIFVHREIQTDPVIIMDAQSQRKFTTASNSGHLSFGDSGIESEMSFQSFINNSVSNTSANHTFVSNTSANIGAPQRSVTVRFPISQTKRRTPDYQKNSRDKERSRSPPRKRPSLGNSLITPKQGERVLPKHSSSKQWREANGIRHEVIQPLRTTPLRIDTSEKKESSGGYHQISNLNKTAPTFVYRGPPQNSDAKPMVATGPMPLFTPHPPNIRYPHLVPHPSLSHGYMTSYAPQHFYGGVPPSTPRVVPAHRQYNNYPPMTPLGVRNPPHCRIPAPVPSRPKF